MDVVDRLIITEMLKNCRISYDELGQKVGLSASTVWRRVMELEESGVIERYKIAFAPQIILSRLVHALLSLDGSSSDEEILERINEDDRVVGITAIINRFCIASYEVQSNSEAEEIENMLDVIPGVVSITTYSHNNDELTIQETKDLDFSENEKELLRLLIDDPRVPIKDLGERTGKSYRRVKKTLDSIIESNKIRFEVEWTPNVEGNDMFLFWITLEPGYDMDEIRVCLQEKYPENYWWAYLTSSENCMFANFAFESVGQALVAKRQVAEHHSIQYAELFFVSSYIKKPWLAERFLRNYLND